MESFFPISFSFFFRPFHFQTTKNELCSVKCAPCSFTSFWVWIRNKSVQLMLKLYLSWMWKLQAPFFFFWNLLDYCWKENIRLLFMIALPYLFIFTFFRGWRWVRASRGSWIQCFASASFFMASATRSPNSIPSSCPIVGSPSAMLGYILSIS